MPDVSIVVPTYNEADNIANLVNRIDMAMDTAALSYELLFIDDHSSDATIAEINKLQKVFPITVFNKEGKRGKSHSLLEGFKKAKADVLAMIDADLQYPPEAIPDMVKEVMAGDLDVVVAHRRKRSTSWIRNFLSGAFIKVFGNHLHKLDTDVQSGLKVFRREIVERIPLNPYPWTFDLEFLVKARNAGYQIGSCDIIFQKRVAGKSKVNLLRTGAELMASAIKLKYFDTEIFPFMPKMMEEEGKGFHYKGSKFIIHTDFHKTESALRRVTPRQSIVLMALGALILFAFIMNWYVSLVMFIALLTVLYFTDLLFNLFLIYRSFSKMPELRVSAQEIAAVPDSAWPTYTIFCPLYQEDSVLTQFVTAMSKLDYPKEKLQIMLLLEEDDNVTISAARNLNLPSYFEITVVPHSFPKTKPKACNYGLTKAKGEMTVIYDAEDVPDPQQLKKAVLAFGKADPRTICIQAKLNFYNPHQNLLTRVFTAEYSLWYDLVLTGLQTIKAPIPLGGTSNHFRTADLHELRGWDPFNVTEDCDLGIRLTKRGFQTALMDSVTMEEANSSYVNWFHQRTRWIKGYMQTYLVHIRDMRGFVNDWREPHLITFQMIVGGKIASMFINPIMWLLTITYFVFRPIVGPTIESFFPTPVLYMAVISLVLGNFLYLYYYMIGCAKREYDDLIKYVFLVPLYWLAMSAAAWMAFYKLITAPHHWPKTKHGMHLLNKKSLAQSQGVVGHDMEGDFSYSDPALTPEPALALQPSPALAYEVVPDTTS